MPGANCRHPLITVTPRHTPRDNTAASQSGWNEIGPVLLNRRRKSPPHEHLGFGLSGTFPAWTVVSSACIVSVSAGRAVLHADACLPEWAVGSQSQLLELPGN